MVRKLMIVALAFSAGALLSQYCLPLAALPWAAGAAAALLGLGRLLKGRRGLVLSLAAGALAVSLLYCFAFLTYIRGGVARLAGQERFLAVEVTAYAEATSQRMRIPVRILGQAPLRGNAMLYGGEELLALSPGDQLSGVMLAEDASSIDGTPIAAFTARGIWLLLYPQGEVAVTPGERSLRYLPQQAAHRLGETADRLYGQRWSTFLKALLFGDRSDFDPGYQSDLSEAGIYHITSVSGLHCGFLLSLIAFFVGRHRRRLLAAIAIPCLILYTLAVSCPASMVRAAVMLSLVLLGPLLGRESDGATSLAFALMVLVAANPCAIAGIGLQLSFASMAGLMLLAPRIYAWFPKPGNRLLQGVVYTLSTSLGCMAVTAPLSALYFNSISLAAPLANILCLWVSSFTFIAGVFSVALGMVFPPLGAAVALGGKAGTWWILTVSEVLSDIPFHAVYFTNPYLKYWLVYAIAAFAYCALTPPERRKYGLAAALTALTLVLVSALPIRERQGRFHAAAIDVGQGASTLLASGGAAALVDCGSSNSYLDAGDAAADALNTWGYFGLDYLILTHYHADHANGLGVLLARLEAETLYAPVPTAGETALHREVADLAERYGVEMVYVTEDLTFPLGEAEVTLFAPVGDGGTNEEGLSVLCTAGDFDLLITGDMNSEHEMLLSGLKDLPDLEVLLVGHHGSQYATSEALLERTSPEVGIISVGDNSYGHPSEEAMQRMVRQGMRLYRTDLQGTVSLLLP